MAVSPELGQQLADLGGFALFLLVIALAAVGLFRQWWVPGYFYRAEREAREKAETQAERNTDSLKANTEALAKVAQAVADERRRDAGGNRSRADADP